MIALLLLAPFLVGQSIADTSSLSLLKRHHNGEGDAFIPGTTPGCPDDWPVCGDSGVCYNPDEGQTCCPGGKYACPSSSYCLFAPYCCSNDLDPDSCAREYGLTMATSHLSNPTQAPDSSSDGLDTSDDPLYPRPTLPPGSASSITVLSTPIPTPASSLIPPFPSVSVWPSSTPGVDEPEYTGAAPGLASKESTGATVGAIVLGIFGYLIG
ncbi:uncharacterized protein BJX67DRAFT_307227 [Aspergillus lucknowensis]|uniref:GPI anchored serine-threonine rich protein n=1 Tax=Aspergillus lucknowensis TaxID=176173 RepID=A0ABR4LZX2_9EURO